MKTKKSHWDEDEKYPVKDWQYEVANDDTRIGYLEWVEHSRFQASADRVPIAKTARPWLYKEHDEE